jgi:predicted MFS family arabinose efflux permease
VWGAVAGLSSATGILLGGVLTEGPGWRWVMFVNPVACAALLPLAWRMLPRAARAQSRPASDRFGGLLITGAMLLLVFALVKAPDQGWGSARTWWEFAGSGVLFGAFAANERAVRSPLLPLSILRVRGLVAANVTGLIGFAGMLSMFFFLTLYMQNVLGYSPIAAGAAYLPLTVGIGVSSGVGAKLLPRIGSRAVICGGALTAAAGLFLLAQLPVHGTYLADILPGLLVFSLGVGPVFVGVTSAANAGVAPDQAGLAAAILNSAQQTGGALGLAIFSAVAASQSGHLLAAGATAAAAAASGFHRALLTGGGFAVAAALIALRTASTPADAMPADRDRPGAPAAPPGSLPPATASGTTAGRR